MSTGSFSSFDAPPAPPWTTGNLEGRSLESVGGASFVSGWAGATNSITLHAVFGISVKRLALASHQHSLAKGPASRVPSLVTSDPALRTWSKNFFRMAVACALRTTTISVIIEAFDSAAASRSLWSARRRALRSPSRTPRPDARSFCAHKGATLYMQRNGVPSFLPEHPLDGACNERE